MTQKYFTVTITVTLILVILSGCNLVYLSSPEDLPGVKTVASPSIEGRWTFVKSESDIQWREHQWLVNPRKNSGYELTEIVEGHETPYNFRGRVLELNDRRLLQVQARSWPPGTMPVFAVYELTSQSEDRVVLGSPNRDKLRSVLASEEFNSPKVIRKKNYPVLVHSTGERSGEFLEELLDRNVFTERLVFERIKP